MFGNLLTALEPKPVKESRRLLFNILEDEKIDYEHMHNTIGKTPTRFARKLDQNLKLSLSIFVASLVSVFLMVSGVWFPVRGCYCTPFLGLVWERGTALRIRRRNTYHQDSFCIGSSARGSAYHLGWLG